MVQEDDSETDDGEETDAQETHESVVPTFGFAANAGVEPPVEPDHEVQLTEREVERDDNPFGVNMEFFFDPTGLYVEPGDTVRFNVGQGVHTITGYHPDVGYEQRVPAESISSPVHWEGTYFMYTFEETGVHDLFCFPHEFLGMVVRVVVGEATGPGAEPVPEPDYAFEEGEPLEDLSQPGGLAAAVLNDEAMAPENIVEQGEVAWDDIATESKRFPEGTFEEPPAPQSLVAVLRDVDVDSEAGGCAEFTPAGDGTLSFTMVLEDIEEVTQAHIHEGERGEDGPVVAPLVTYSEELDGSGEGEPRTAAPDEPIVDSGAVEDAEVVQAVLEDPAGHYVNVHTTANPAGEIRGQLRETGPGVEPVDEEPEEMPEEETPDETPEETPEGTPEETPEETPEGTATPTETPTPDGTPTPTPGEEE